MSEVRTDMSVSRGRAIDTGIRKPDNSRGHGLCPFLIVTRIPRFAPPFRFLLPPWFAVGSGHFYGFSEPLIPAAGANVDVGAILQFLDAGGVLGALVVMAVYLASQNRRLSNRNDELVDRHQKLSEQHATLAAEIKAGLDKLADRFSARH